MTLDPEEFNDVVKKVHGLLLTRYEKAKDKKDLHPTKRSNENYVEAAKDVFVFSHMVELIEHMSAEISDLRDVLDGLGEMQHVDEELPEIFATKKTHFLN